MLEPWGTWSTYIELEGCIISVHPYVLELWKQDMGPEIRVAETVRDDFRLITTFTGIDQNFTGHGPPLLYETLLITAEFSEPVNHYSTREQAQLGHDRLVHAFMEPTTVAERRMEER